MAASTASKMESTAAASRVVDRSSISDVNGVCFWPLKLALANGRIDNYALLFGGFGVAVDLPNSQAARERARRKCGDYPEFNFAF
jgi:hypothetical protein